MVSHDMFSAELGQDFAAGPGTQAPVARVRDVILCPIDTTVQVSPEEFRAHPPVDAPAELQFIQHTGPIEIGQGVRLESLSRDEADLVMNACTPRGHYFFPVRQFGQRFSMLRTVPVEEWELHPFHFDSNGALSDALMISRLVRDHGYSLQYAARITDYDDGQQMVSYVPGVEGKAAYRLRHDRDWPDPDEAMELRGLLSAFWEAEGTLPPRVRRATFRTEYACWSQYADQVLPMVVSGLEALLKVGRRRLTQQFVQRTSVLADELAVDDVTEEFCNRMYDARSDWVHGSHAQLFRPPTPSTDGGEIVEGPERDTEREALGEVAKLQDVLRAAVRRCVEDPEFREIFESDDAIRERWPVPDA
jgi:hypothetical protein